MANIKKFRIAGLKRKESFSDAAKVILNNKLHAVFDEIRRYNKNNSPNNLHKLRIALRRLRYNLEIFYDCIKPRQFKTVYEYVKHMQDLIGELRDLDVLEEKIRKLEDETSCSIPPNLYEKLSSERIPLKKKIQEELTLFVSNKDLNKFLIQ